MKLLNYIRSQTQQLLKGRYGSDPLNIFLVYSALLLMIIGIFLEHNLFLTVLNSIIILIAYMRIFSKNFTKRAHENQLFLHYFTPIQKKLLKYSLQIKHLKSHKYLTCSHCKQSLRVPRGKGKICVTCPKCKSKIHTHS